MRYLRWPDPRLPAGFSLKLRPCLQFLVTGLSGADWLVAPGVNIIAVSNWIVTSCLVLVGVLWLQDAEDMQPEPAAWAGGAQGARATSEPHALHGCRAAAAQRRGGQHHTSCLAATPLQRQMRFV